MIHIRNSHNTYITIDDNLSFDTGNLDENTIIFESLSKMNEDMEMDWGLDSGKAKGRIGTYVLLNNGVPAWIPYWQRASTGDRIPLKAPVETFVNNLDLSERKFCKYS